MQNRLRTNHRALTIGFFEKMSPKAAAIATIARRKNKKGATIKTGPFSSSVEVCRAGGPITAAEVTQTGCVGQGASASSKGESALPGGSGGHYSCRVARGSRLRNARSLRLPVGRGHPQFPLVYLVEHAGRSPCPPQLQLRIAPCLDDKVKRGRREPCTNAGHDLVTAPLKPFGDAQQRCQLHDHILDLRLEPLKLRVRLPRRRATMIARQVRHDLDLIRHKPLPVGLHDEVLRMLVVTTPTYMIADVVQQRRILEQLALAHPQPVHRPAHIE